MTVVLEEYSISELEKILKEKYISVIALIKSASSLTNSKDAKSSIIELRNILLNYANGLNADIVNSFQIILIKLHSLRVMGRLNKLSRDIFQYLYQDLITLKKTCDYYDSQCIIKGDN